MQNTLETKKQDTENCLNQNAGYKILKTEMQDVVYLKPRCRMQSTFNEDAELMKIQEKMFKMVILKTAL